MPVVLNNSIIESSPFGITQYDTQLYGSSIFQDYVKVVKVKYSLLGGQYRRVHVRYKIKARYTRTETTIEDIYVSATARFMKLGCLDGPLLPYFSKAYDVEGDVIE